MSEIDAERIAAAWIEMTRDPDSCSDEVFDAGFRLNTLCYDDFNFAWDLIKKIVESQNDGICVATDGGKPNVMANLGSGPLETLLAQHGDDIIDEVEAYASVSEECQLALGFVWQNSMSDKVRLRVQRASGASSE